MLRAVIRREITTTLYNRYVQVFALLLVTGSLVVVGAAGGASAVPFGVLLLLLYVVPLFAVLVGVHSAQEELEEWPVLFSHPLPRRTLVAGKLAVLVGAMTAVMTVALVPVAGRVASVQPLAVLWGLGLALVAVWCSTGLAVGVYTANRARGLVAGLCVWFASLVLYDLCTLLLSGVPAVQSQPAVWTSILLFNPADAVRLAGMTALEGVSFTAPGSSDAVATLLAWTPAWTAVLTVGWTAAASAIACRTWDPVAS